MLSPKDIVAARSRDWDDRVSWLLQRRRYQDALQLARRQQAALCMALCAWRVAWRIAQRITQHVCTWQAHLVRHKLLDVAELLLGHLLHDEHRPAAAAELCPELLGDAVGSAPLISPRRRG